MSGLVLTRCYFHFGDFTSKRIRITQVFKIKPRDFSLSISIQVCASTPAKPPGAVPFLSTVTIWPNIIINVFSGEFHPILTR